MSNEASSNKAYDEEALTADANAMVRAGIVQGYPVITPDEAACLTAITHGLCRSDRAADFFEIGRDANKYTADMILKFLDQIQTRLKEIYKTEDERLAEMLNKK